MVRVKRGVNAHKKREKLLRYTKGFKWGRKSKERLAREALLHAWPHAFRGRKERKRNYRALWQTQIGAGAKINGLSYSKLMDSLHKKNIALDRKILAQIAQDKPEVFAKIVEYAK
jgi:large subunit ribosomal protein L20